MKITGINEVNKQQQEFYNTKKKNVATRLWSSLRGGLLNRMRKDIGVHDQTYALHKEWFGDLSEKKVLDLGCFAGNNLTMHLAQNAKQYVGIDLSDIAIAKLAKRLENLPNAKALAVDFLSDDFSEYNFDLIYAYGVLHHFKDTPLLIAHLKKRLRPDGEIISYDPLQTSFPIKVLRTLYRPFQSDAAWEWPFSKKTYMFYESAFHIKERHGILGKAKWFFLVGLMPISQEKKLKLGRKWHETDWQKSATHNSHLFSCMHLTMLMQNRT